MDGLNSPAELVKAAKDAGQTALAITDHGTLGSHREMQIACAEQGIKPILGVEAYISPTDRFDRSSKTSYKSLLGMKVSTISPVLIGRS
jgi:DNA polymerase-3 subunit alpha